jgi:hypothetical protein
MRTQVLSWSSASFDGTYQFAKAQSVSLNEYKSSRKREWVTERQDLVSLFGKLLDLQSLSAAINLTDISRKYTDETEDLQAQTMDPLTGV